MKIVYTSMNYKSSAYRSVISVLLGLGLVLWPETALTYIVMLIGLTFLLIGLISFVIACRSRKEHPGKLLPFSGVGSMALGLLLICMPAFFQTIFMFLLGFVLVLAAVAQFVALAAARRFGFLSPVSYLFPVLILAAGLVVISNPFETSESVAILFGAAAMFYGLTDWVSQYGIRKLRRAREAEGQDGGPEAEDADYEEVE